MSFQIAQADASLIVKVTIILASGLLAVAALRRLSAAVRHLALLVTAGSAVVLPFALAVAPRWAFPVLPPATGQRTELSVQAKTERGAVPAITPNTVPLSRPDAGHEQSTIAAGDAPDDGPMWLALVPALWGIGALMMVLRMCVGHVRLQRIARQAQHLRGGGWQALLNAESEHMGVGKPVRLLVSRMTTTPLTWGMHMPVILLPHEADGWTDVKLRAVLRHELSHIARGDAAARWLTAILCMLYWFHPLAWIVARALHAEAELACDDQVLVSGILAEEYAGHLLDIARATRAAGVAELLAVRMASQPHIARRILAVLDASRRRHMLTPLGRRVAVAGGTFSVLVASACQFVPRADAQAVQSISGVRSTEGGVTVVSHAASVFTRAPQFELERAPVARTQTAEFGTENDLRYLRAAVLLSDGRIAAFRMIDPVVFIFGSAGELQRRIGKLGKATGDFTSPDGMGLLARDTLWIPDDNNARVNWITADGGFVRTAPLPRPSGGFLLDPRGQLRDGRIVMGSSVLSWDMGEGTWRPAMPIVVTDPALRDSKTVATVPGFEMTRITTNYRGRKSVDRKPLRFGRHASVVAWDTLIAVATGANGYEIEQRNDEGALIGRLRVDQPRRPVTQAMRDAQIDVELARIDQPKSEAYVDIEETRRQARENPFADSLPPYVALFATKSGTLWVVDAIAPSDTSWSATAFRADGSVTGRLHAHMTSFPRFFGDDRVLVSVQDAIGRVSLRVHRIVAAKR